MEQVKLHTGDYLVIDPGYIKNVTTEWNGQQEQRFDALRLVKVLHDGDDGFFNIYVGDNDEPWELGVDSGRLWVMQAEFDVDLMTDCECSGRLVIENDKGIKLKDIVIGHKGLSKYAFIKELGRLVNDYGSDVESVGAFDEHGNAVQEITFKVDNKEYYITFGKKEG